MQFYIHGEAFIVSIHLSEWYIDAKCSDVLQNIREGITINTGLDIMLLISMNQQLGKFRIQKLRTSNNEDFRSIP